MCVLNTRNLFLIGLEAGKPEKRVRAVLSFGEGFLSDVQKATYLLCPHMAEKERRLWFPPLPRRLPV